MLVRNGCGLLGLQTLKSTVSKEWIDEKSWLFSCWYKFRKAKSYFNKNEWGLIDHGTLESVVSQKWCDNLSILIEWFLHANSDGIIFDLMATPIYFVLYLWHLNGGGPLHLQLARVFRKNFLWAKMTPK